MPKKDFKDYDWEKLKDVGMFNFTPGEVDFVPEPEVQPRWKIPEKVAIQVAISGGGAAVTPKQNPNHPGADLDSIRDSAEQVIPEGPTLIHFDHMQYSCHTKEGREMSFGDSYTYTVKPLLEKYGREKVLAHCNCLRGDFRDQMTPVLNDIAELTYMHAKGSLRWLQTTLPILRENDVKAELVIHDDGEIDLTERLLIRTGLSPNPNLWILLHGLPNRIPSFFRVYMPNEKAMVQGLMFTVERIKEIDPEGLITVCCAGRASKYLVTLALLLGLNIRVGHEDTVWRYPHKDEKIVSNAEETRWAVSMARMLGREPMTPNEYRQAIGLKPRTDFAPEGLKMP